METTYFEDAVYVKEDWDADLKEECDAHLDAVYVKEDWDADLKEDWDADHDTVYGKEHADLHPIKHKTIHKQSQVSQVPLHPDLMKRRRAAKYGLHPDVFICPYNRSHSIDWEKASKHLRKCRELPVHKDSPQVPCPLVDGHTVPVPEMEFHVLTCSGDLYKDRKFTISTPPGCGGKLSTPNYELPYNFANAGSRWL